MDPSEAVTAGAEDLDDPFVGLEVESQPEGRHAEAR